jgi:hypothetical protein
MGAIDESAGAYMPEDYGEAIFPMDVDEGRSNLAAALLNANEMYCAKLMNPTLLR